MTDVNGRLREITEIAEQVVKLQDVVKDSGFEWNRLIEMPPPPVHQRWIAIPSLGLLVVALAIASVDFNNKILTVMYVLGLALCGWATVSTHLCYKKKTSTGIVCFFGFVVLLVAGRFMAPMDAYDQAKSMLQLNPTMINAGK